jgi:hypothetical protein
VLEFFGAKAISPSSSAGNPQPADRFFSLILFPFWRNDGLPGSDQNSFYGVIRASNTEEVRRT